MPLRAATFALLGLRVAYGVALIAAPERLALRWLGPAAGEAPTQVAAARPGRARDRRARRRDRRRAAATCRCARSWPRAPRATSPTSPRPSAAAAGCPPGAAPATLAVAGGSALLTAGLAAAVDR